MSRSSKPAVKDALRRLGYLSPAGGAPAAPVEAAPVSAAPASAAPVSAAPVSVREPRKQTHSEILTELAELTMSVVRALLTEVEGAVLRGPMTSAAVAQYASSFKSLGDSVIRSIALANQIDRDEAARLTALLLHVPQPAPAPSTEPKAHPAVRPPATRH